MVEQTPSAGGSYDHRGGVVAGYWPQPLRIGEGIHDTVPESIS